MWVVRQILVREVLNLQTNKRSSALPFQEGKVRKRKNPIINDAIGEFTLIATAKEPKKPNSNIRAIKN